MAREWLEAAKVAGVIEDYELRSPAGRATIHFHGFKQYASDLLDVIAILRERGFELP